MGRGIFVKTCGLCTVEAFLGAIDAGADAAGFVDHPRSPRHIGIDSLREILNSAPSSSILKVGVFVNPSLDEVLRRLDLGIDTIQLHGDETPDFALSLRRHVGKVWKAFAPRTEEDIIRMKDFPADAFVVDAFNPSVRGGGGAAGDWMLARSAVAMLPAPVILAGGLNQDNVGRAICEVNPFGVDASSGMEKAPGVKSIELLRGFVLAGKSA